MLPRSDAPTRELRLPKRECELNDLDRAKSEQLRELQTRNYESFQNQLVPNPQLERFPLRLPLAQRLLPRGAGAVFSFELKGDRAAGRRFVEALQVFSHLANVGDARSLVIHPASTTHFRMDAAALAAAGIGVDSPEDLEYVRGLLAAGN